MYAKIDVEVGVYISDDETMLNDTDAETKLTMALVFDDVKSAAADIEKFMRRAQMNFDTLQAEQEAKSE